MRKIIRTTLLFYLLVLSATAEAAQDYAPNIVEKDYVAYLFAYFHGNRVEEEQICFAISLDGYNYRALNHDRPVIDSKDISETGGVRDPHILRAQDGETFYMVVTDMTSSKGWDSNRGMVLLKSKDLVNWSSSAINIQKKYPGQEELKRVWAPQTIYDPIADKYMIYWLCSTVQDRCIYYAYANKNLLIWKDTQAAVLPKRQSCIDGDIIYKNGIFHMFYKTEGHGNGIKRQ